MFFIMIFKKQARTYIKNIRFAFMLITMKILSSNKIIQILHKIKKLLAPSDQLHRTQILHLVEN